MNGRSGTTSLVTRSSIKAPKLIGERLIKTKADILLDKALSALGCRCFHFDFLKELANKVEQSGMIDAADKLHTLNDIYLRMGPLHEAVSRLTDMLCDEERPDCVEQPDDPVALGRALLRAVDAGLAAIDKPPVDRNDPLWKLVLQSAEIAFNDLLSQLHDHGILSRCAYCGHGFFPTTHKKTVCSLGCDGRNCAANRKSKSHYERTKSAGKKSVK